MRPIWMLAVVPGVALAMTAGPAMAQGLIPPSRQYVTPQREKLDKNYGLPTFGTQGDSMPKQQAVTSTPKQAEQPDSFKAMPSFATPEAPASDGTPDFFQKPSGLATSETGVPNFFQDRPVPDRPKIGAKRDGETPMFTTDEGSTTGDTSTSPIRAGDAAAD